MKLLILGLLPYVFCAGGLMGGLKKQSNPESNPETLNAVSIAMLRLNGLLTDDPEMSNEKIVSAETQVVSGINYFLTLKVKYGSEVKQCKVVVWVQSWTNTKKVTSQDCINMSAPAPRFLGGAVSATLDAETEDAIIKAIEQFNGRSNNLFRSLPVNITNLKTQVVEGVLYSFDATMQSTTCQNNAANKNKGLQECAPNNSAAKQVCSMNVLVRDWMKDSTQVKMNCKQSHADKIKVLGGEGHDFCNGGHFADFKINFKKSYKTTEEESKRFDIFCENMKKAKKIQDVEKGSARYGPTIFADLTEDEFRMRLNPKPWKLDIKPSVEAKIPKGPFPKVFDWREHGAVTTVKNQGSCGSCWAFSTTGNIEGQWAIKKKRLISLSEQELVDCDKVDEGCNGGLPSQAYQAVMKLGGLETEKDYGYKGHGEKCFFNKTEAVVKINGSLKISENETEMAAWLAKNGPISIGINAFAMQFYMGGISHPWKIFCNPSSLDHGVLIVGYGVDGTEPYWIIKNSWGPDWGEKGYYMLYRGAGACGVNKMCTSATVA